MPEAAETFPSRAPSYLWPGEDGVRIAADTFGRPGDPALILLHGGGQTRHAWRRTAESLARDGWHVVIYDGRGHGDSDWSDHGDYDEAALVSDLVTVIAASAAMRPVLAGASAGGATALAAVGRGLVDARALILVDVVPHTELEGYERIRAFMLAGMKGFSSLEEAAKQVALFRGLDTPPNAKSIARNLRRTDEGRYRWHWDPRYVEARDVDRRDRHERLADYARCIAIPTLLVRGGDSDVVSEEGVREFLSMCPHADYVNVEDAGHMLVGDRNDIFGAVARPFLQKLAGP
jgi:pimeloyl-ACP methyl ester carboxylesterase